MSNRTVKLSATILKILGNFAQLLKPSATTQHGAGAALKQCFYELTVAGELRFQCARRSSPLTRNVVLIHLKH